ncbi:MAG: RtcB family protein [Halanaerobiales bacterium]|nr:RtcB family protein [Halanaerobiales bacterium]
MRYYNFPAEGDRNCDVRLFATEELYQDIEQTALKQLFNASQLPGIISVVGMPDLHQGYGLPIGGVMVSKFENAIISPGAVGFDINCGVRLLTTGLNFTDLGQKIESLMAKVKAQIPAGLGSKRMNSFQRKDFKQIVEEGVPFLVQKQGSGTEDDIENCEENGFLEPADFGAVPEKAVERGLNQLGTLGSGNHFLELQKVDKVYDQSCGLEENQITFMIHTGSRGFGHQIAKHYTELAKSSGVKTPNKSLASFRFNSREGQQYLQAMAAAANFAFANRQLITHDLRQLLQGIYSGEKLPLYYDLTHNVVKKEVQQGEEYLVHRKGATRLPPDGIALIPGSMGTYSYLIRSSNSEATAESYHSVAHGAGRKMSRTQAKKTINQERHKDKMGTVRLYQSGSGSILDESPLAYKDINEIIDSLQKTEIAAPMARLKPLAVLKG